MEPGFREGALRTTDGLMLGFREYGSRISDATPVLCLPGLTRNAKDFHAIATEMAPHRRVVALDARGRGSSDYDPEWRNYNLVTEVGDVLALLTAEFDRPCVILGTSRGGLAAMILSGVRPAMLAGIVLNDIGPVLEPKGLERIMGYLGVAPDQFESWDDAVMALRRTNEIDFPNMTDDQWMAWAKRTFREEDGKPALDYDPRLRDAALENAGPIPDFWPQFRHMADIPTLVLRGEFSDLLSAETVSTMKRTKTDLTTVTVRDRGHVPFLDEPEAKAAIFDFIDGIDARARAA